MTESGRVVARRTTHPPAQVDPTRNCLIMKSDEAGLPDDHGQTARGFLSTALMNQIDTAPGSCINFFVAVPRRLTT